MYNKIIEFNINSSFGCFNKAFSNKGGLLTYSIPPKTTIIGMIGAVLGIEFDDFDEDTNTYAIEKLYDIKISIQMLSNLKTSRVVFNNCDKSISNINQDLLINPSYKIFVSFPDSLKEYETIFENNLKNHETIYNLYMGRNEFLLNYEYIKTFDNKTYTFNNDEIDSVKIIGTIKRSNIKNISVYKEEKDNVHIFGRRIDNIFHEFLVRDYPIKRSNFTKFDYEFISFFIKEENIEEAYFNEIELKKNATMNLSELGEDKWIQLI